MHIAVNLRQYYKGKIGGMDNYVRNILGGLSHHRLTIWVHNGEVASVREFAPSAKIIGIRHEEGTSPIEDGLRRGSFDVFFCPLLVLEPLVVSQPSAVMMPDVQHEFFPEFFEPGVLQWRRKNYGPSALNADVLFTLSEHAKSTIVEKFRVAPEKIVVIHLDADPEFRRPLPRNPTQAFLDLKLPTRYLYFPANFWPHKNHSNVLKGLRLAIAEGEENLHLVLSGFPAGSEELESEVKRLGLEGKVHFKGYLDKRVIPEVYHNAIALLFATKFEGFGIPLLEALYCGTPVVTSHSGSCVEVAGDAAVLVDPLSPESIANGIRRIASDPDLRHALVARGTERVKEFSWRRAIDLTESALKAVTDPSYRKPSRISVSEWPRIGIVTPAYNMAQFLEEAITSVLSQDYPNLDYVVMDAGSKDGTIDILRKYEGKLRWVSERDNGQADAINKGWHALTGDIFAFLNADDTYLPNALATIAGHFKRNPGVGMIYGEAYHVDVNGEILDRYPTQPFDFQSLNNQCYVCQPAAFLLHEAYANAGMMNVNMHYALDYELWIRVARQYGVKKIDEYLATSRMHKDNKTLSSRRKVYQEIISAVKAQYGYVPYEWVNGYSCFLLDNKDQYFDRSKPTISSHALSLLIGSYHNPNSLRRYWSEWRQMTGIGGQFNGRWEDGWISRRYECGMAISPNSAALRIVGKHSAPIENLRLQVRIDTRTIEDQRLPSPGPFVIEVPLPTEFRGKQCQLSIESNRTWRPRANGDYRQLSCIIDTLEQVRS
ncbi:MAG: glycosyltransferase [Acidobacteria bacterium]|nr:glycosyltransferase [Acidobacteriota bacterium]